MDNYNNISDSIVLGDGELYLAYYEDVIDADENLKAESDIISALKMVGAIDSGATITYKPSNTTIKPANRPKFYIKTDEECTFKSGTLNFIPENVSYVAPVIQTEDITTHVKKLVVGGKQQAPNVYLRYIHTEPDGSIIQLDMTECQCINGTSFAFNDKPVVLDMEFDSLTGMTDVGCMAIQFIPSANSDNLPTVSVAGLTFTDTNTAAGTIAGNLTWTAPGDESKVIGYNIYLLDSDNRKVGDKLVSVSKGVNTFTMSNTIVGGATQIAVFAYNNYGESKYSTKIAITDITA